MSYSHSTPAAARKSTDFKGLQSETCQLKTALDIPDRSQAEINYHLLLLTEAGLLFQADMTKSPVAVLVLPIRLTWQGHEFLDAIKNDTVWQRIKDTVKEKGGSIPFDVLKALALKYVGSLFLGG